MVNIAIHQKYIQALQVFGDLQETIEQALQRYAVERITEKIVKLSEREKAYQAQYGMKYPLFEKKIAEDYDFATHVEKDIALTWELDLADWEFCYKGIQDWTRKLTTILMT
jgi:hypothetical protein